MFWRRKRPAAAVAPLQLPQSSYREPLLYTTREEARFAALLLAMRGEMWVARSHDDGTWEAVRLADLPRPDPHCPLCLGTGVISGSPYCPRCM